MKIYNIIFVNFYKLRKNFNDKNNEIWASSFITMLQGLQICCILILSILCGLPVFFVKSLPIIIGLTLILYFINAIYFYSPKQAQKLIEIDSLLSEKDRRRNAYFALIAVAVTIFAVFEIVQIAHSYHVN